MAEHLPSQSPCDFSTVTVGCEDTSLCGWVIMVLPIMLIGTKREARQCEEMVRRENWLFVIVGLRQLSSLHDVCEGCVLLCCTGGCSSVAVVKEYEGVTDEPH